MSIETALKNLLAGDAPVAGLLTGPDELRIYPLLLPQNPTLPALVYQELPSGALAAADGDTGQRESRFQLSWWGYSYAQVKAGKAALEALLVGYRGGIIERIDWDWSRDDFEESTEWYREIVEIDVLWLKGE